MRKITVRECLDLMTVIFLLIGYSSYAQIEEEPDINSELPTVIGPSPEVASLLKYVDFPVNHSAGIADISLPIHELIEGEITLPISLNYFTGGIKVNEEASSVGLGWSLSAGGVIGRNIKHHPDDGGTVGYMRNNFNDLADIPLSEGALTEYFETHDTEPDLFYFSFMGHNGKFQFIKDPQHSNGGSFVQLKKSDVTIDYETNSSGHIEQFIFTDPQGTKYYFGKGLTYPDAEGIERIHNVTFTSPFGSNPPVVSGVSEVAWHLMEVRDFTGRKILFYYDGPENSNLDMVPVFGGQRFIKAQQPVGGCLQPGEGPIVILTIIKSLLPLKELGMRPQLWPR